MRKLKENHRMSGPLAELAQRLYGAQNTPKPRTPTTSVWLHP